MKPKSSSVLPSGASIVFSMYVAKYGPQAVGSVVQADSIDTLIDVRLTFVHLPAHCPLHFPPWLDIWEDVELFPFSSGSLF